MPKFLDVLVDNASTAFIAMGVVWLAIAVLSDAALILWPVLACIAGGIMLKQWPAGRFTWAWAVASASMGFLLSAYQVYAWLSFVGGAFSALATGLAVGFAVLAVGHVFLFYAGTAKPAAKTPA